MKKLFVVVAFLSFGYFANAQEVGIRFGDVTGNNDVAVDAVFSTGQFSRIHADVSFGDGVGVEALWDALCKVKGWYGKKISHFKIAAKTEIFRAQA